MDPEVTLESLGEAVNAFRDELAKPNPNQEVLEKVTVFLDAHEEKINQPLTQAAALAAKNEAEVKDLKDALQAKGVEAGETRARVDALELELARSGGASSDASWKDGEEYKAINEFCKLGSNMDPELKQLLRTDIGIEGGFLAPTELDTEITKIITEIDGLRSVSRVRTIASKSLEVPIRDVIPVATYEAEQVTGSDSVANYTTETLTPYRQTFTSPITLDMLMDSAFDMESEIASDAAEAFAFGEGVAFIDGSGVREPAGILQNATIQANDFNGKSGAPFLHAEDVIKLTGELKFGYNPVYVMNRATLARIRGLRAAAVGAGDEEGGFLWNPSIMDPAVAGPQGNNTINGFPYVIAQTMPDVGVSGARPIAFGDFRRGYTIVDRTGMTVVRDEFTLKKRGIVEFTMNRWNTGQVTLAEAITLLQITA